MLRSEHRIHGGYLPVEQQSATLVEVLRELTIAWKNRVAYPDGHPARAEALARAHHKLTAFVEAGPLLLGVAPDGWVVEDGKIEAVAVQPIARALYEREVAIVGFEPGIETGELATFLGLLSKDPRRASAASIGDELKTAGVRNIYVEAMDFSHIGLEPDATVADSKLRREIWDLILGELVAGRQLSEDGSELDQENRRRLDELSALLAEALGGTSEDFIGGELGLEGHGGGDLSGAAGTGTGTGTGIAVPGTGPGTGVATGIGTGIGTNVGTNVGTNIGSGNASVPGRGGRSDQAGRRLAGLMAAVFSPARGGASIGTARRLAAVVRSLPEALRRSLIDAIVRQLATGEEAGEMLTTFTSGLPRQSVLASLHRLAEEQVVLSARAVRLARELQEAQPDALGIAAQGRQADRLVAELRGLYGSVDVDRLNPAVVAPVGAPLALEMPRPRPLEAQQVPELGERRDTLSEDFLAEQLARALLELAVRQAPFHLPRGLMHQLRSQFRTILANGRLQLACEIAETLRRLCEDPGVHTEERLQLQLTLDRMADRRAVAALLDGLQNIVDVEVERVHRLMTLLGPLARRHLLSALGDEPDRSRRHLLLRILTAFGSEIAGDVEPLLGDTRWYVVRNAIVLVRATGARSALEAIARATGHRDSRVRLEAIKTLLAFESEIPQEELRRAILDTDLKLAEAVVTLAGVHRVAAAREPLLELLAHRDAFGRRRTVRLRAIKVLGSLRDPSLLPRLRRFFRIGWFAAPREERLAAYEALVYYPVEDRRSLVERGLRSRDPELKAICARLQEGAAAAELEETRA